MTEPRERRAFVDWVRMWWSGPHGFPVVPAGSQAVVDEDFEDMVRELADLGWAVVPRDAARAAASPSGDLDWKLRDLLRGTDDPAKWGVPQDYANGWIAAINAVRESLVEEGGSDGE